MTRVIPTTNSNSRSVTRGVRRAVRSRVVVAGAAIALDELREALAHADRLIAEAQARIGDVYDVLPSEGDR